MRKTRMILILSLMVFMLAAASWVHGQTDLPAEKPCLPGPVAKSATPQGNQWQFRVVPFMWAPTIDSKTTVGGYDVETTTSFSDIWRNLNGALMLHLEAQKDKFGFFFEPTYMKLKSDGTFQRRRDLNVPVIPRDISVVYEQWMIEFGGFYQVGKWSIGDGKKQQMTFDALAGGRYWWVRADLDTSTAINPVKSNQWIDPLVGARLTADLSERVNLNIRGDVGGFGAGSDFSWNGVITLGYRFSDHITGLLGYRALYVNYKNGSGGSRYEETIHGPVMGIAFVF